MKIPRLLPLPKVNFRLFKPVKSLASARLTQELILYLTDEELRMVVTASKSPTGKEVLRWANLNMGEVSEGGLIEKIRAQLTEWKVTNPKLIAVVPSRWAITRNIEIPSRDPKEIQEIVSLQATRHTPYTRSDIVVDYLSLGVFKSAYTKVFLVIVPRVAVKRYFNISEGLNLSLERVVFAPEAMSRSVSNFLSLESEKAPTVLVHVDTASSDFMVIFKGLLLFVRNLPMGARDFSAGVEPQGTHFIEELRKSMEAYQNENIGQSPGTVVLTGAIRSLENWDLKIEEAIGLRVKNCAYEEALSLHEGLRPSASDPVLSLFGALAPALLWGDLAMELVPEESKLRKNVEERAKEVVKMGVLAMVCLFLACAAFLSQLYFRKAQMSVLARRFEPMKKEAATLEQAYARIQSIRSHLVRRGQSVESLSEIYELLPDNIYLTDIHFEEGEKFIIKGTSVARPSIFNLVSGMERSSLFRNVHAKYVSGRTEEGREVSDFEILAAFE